MSTKQLSGGHWYGGAVRNRRSVVELMKMYSIFDNIVAVMSTIIDECANNDMKFTEQFCRDNWKDNKLNWAENRMKVLERHIFQPN